ncbi:hypothetical protein OBBRIDRAFT_242487 [Obba rivulosa]|uniref:Uncharacterized protein n=1 Tax=Obba rivulosa TaxID=1052685 RepID=A0A8E2AQ95_9APHY|nr:hypothetical protein OBBRIDRAFT_242487 [Obba rivulosa]
MNWLSRSRASLQSSWRHRRTQRRRQTTKLRAAFRVASATPRRGRCARGGKTGGALLDRGGTADGGRTARAPGGASKRECSGGGPPRPDARGLQACPALEIGLYNQPERPSRPPARRARCRRAEARDESGAACTGVGRGGAAGKAGRRARIGRVRAGTQVAAGRVGACASQPCRQRSGAAPGVARAAPRRASLWPCRSPFFASSEVCGRAWIACLSSAGPRHRASAGAVWVRTSRARRLLT